MKRKKLGQRKTRPSVWDYRPPKKPKGWGEVPRSQGRIHSTEGRIDSLIKAGWYIQQGPYTFEFAGMSPQNDQILDKFDDPNMFRIQRLEDIPGLAIMVGDLVASKRRDQALCYIPFVDEADLIHELARREAARYAGKPRPAPGQPRFLTA